MNDSLLPNRYAKALLKFADEKGKSAPIYALMKTLAGSFEGNPTLAQALANPYVDREQKTQLAMTAAGATAKENGVYADFLKMLLDNRRIDQLRQIALSYLSLYRKANGIHLVDVTTAAPLSDQALARLKKLIADRTGGETLEFTQSVDPSLLGGFVVTIDSERLDASLQNEIKQLRLNLLSK